ncbi:hypothetical protein RCL1_005931 [Eukaryota sp. TZLM3-RCL]
MNSNLDSDDCNFVNCDLQGRYRFAVRSLKLRDSIVGERLLVLTDDGFRLLIFKVDHKKRILRQNIHIFLIKSLSVTGLTQFRIELATGTDYWLEFDVISISILPPVVSMIMNSLLQINRSFFESYTSFSVNSEVNSLLTLDSSMNIHLAYRASCNKAQALQDELILSIISNFCTSSNPNPRITLDSRTCARRGVERCCALLYFTTLWDLVKSLSLEFSGVSAVEKALPVVPGGKLFPSPPPYTDVLDSLCFLFKFNSSLESLSLSRLKMSGSEWEIIFSHLKANKSCSIVFWNFSECNLGNTGLIEFSNLLPSFSPPFVISLPFIGANSIGLDHLITKLTYFSTPNYCIASIIRVIDLSGNTFSNQFTISFENSLKLFRSLIELNISNTRVNIDLLCKSKLISQQKFLKSFKISRNHLTFNDVVSLSNTVLEFEVLTCLDFFDCSLSVSSILTLLNALKRSRLKELPLIVFGENSIRSKEVADLFKFISGTDAQSIKFDRLSMSFPSVSPTILSMFFSDLSMFNSNLKQLELINTINTSLAPILANHFHCFSKLEVLSIIGGFNHKINQSISAIILELPRLPQLVSLDISDNDCRDDCTRSFSFILPSLKLKKLKLDKNNISQAGLSVMTSLIESIINQNSQLLIDCPVPKYDVTRLLQNAKINCKYLFITADSFIKDVENLVLKWYCAVKRINNK